MNTALPDGGEALSGITTMVHMNILLSSYSEVPIL